MVSLEGQRLGHVAWMVSDQLQRFECVAQVPTGAPVGHQPRSLALVALLQSTHLGMMAKFYSLKSHRKVC